MIFTWYTLCLSHDQRWSRRTITWYARDDKLVNHVPDTWLLLCIRTRDHACTTCHNPLPDQRCKPWGLIFFFFFFLNAGGPPTRPREKFWVGYESTVRAVRNLISALRVPTNTVCTNIEKFRHCFHPKRWHMIDPPTEETVVGWQETIAGMPVSDYKHNNWAILLWFLIYILLL